MTRTNEHGQPVGAPLAWSPAHALGPVELAGRYVGLEPLGPRHAADLYAATCGEDRAPTWTYLFDEMPASPEACAAYVERRAAVPGLTSLAIRPAGGRVAGVASWLRAEPAHGSIEVGGIVFGPDLQRTTAATEAMWLMARHAFERGYRRYEWKCDALNAPSRAAATRLGFTYEGTFRNAVVYKGRSRDTAWFSVTDEEWRALEPAYDAWLAPANFDDPVAGTGQRSSLSRRTAEALGTLGSPR